VSIAGPIGARGKLPRLLAVTYSAMLTARATYLTILATFSYFSRCVTADLADEISLRIAVISSGSFAIFR
jgi:hypothetical protein